MGHVMNINDAVPVGDVVQRFSCCVSIGLDACPLTHDLLAVPTDDCKVLISAWQSGPQIEGLSYLMFHKISSICPVIRSTIVGLQGL